MPVPGHVVAAASAGPSNGRDASRPGRAMAHLSWLGIWNRALSGNSKGKGRQEEQDAVRSSAVDNDAGAASGVQEEEDEEDDESGLLYASTGPGVPSMDKATLGRRIGLAQGLMDFSRSFASTPGEADDGLEDQTREIRVVTSANQKLVFLQAEPGFWITASFTHLPPVAPRAEPISATNASSPRSRESSSASTLIGQSAFPSSPGKTDAKAGARNRTRLPPKYSNEAYRGVLERAYDDFKLFHGTFSQCLQDGGKAGLQAQLQAYFDVWRAGPLPLDLLGINISPHAARISDQGNPASRPELSSADVLIVGRSSGILVLPPASDAFTHPASLAIARHLLTLIPPEDEPPDSTNSTLISAPMPKGKGHTGHTRRQPSTSASSWRTLGLGNVGSYLRVPSIPGLSKSNTAEEEPPPVPPLPKGVLQSGSEAVAKDADKPTDWMAIGTFGLMRSSSTSANGKIVENAAGRGGQRDLVEGAHASTPIAPQQNDHDDATRVETEETAKLQKDLKSLLPAFSHATVDDELKEAIEGEISSIQHKVSQAGMPAPNKERVLTALQRVRPAGEASPVFADSEGSIPRQMTCFTLDDLAMALILPPEHADSAGTREAGQGDPSSASSIAAASRYLCEISELLNSQKGVGEHDTTDSLPAQQTYMSRQHRTPISIRDTAVASTATPASWRAQASQAVQDASAYSALGVHGIMLRTAQGGWIIARSDAAGRPAASPMRVAFSDVTILPKSIGKEGSIMDAEGEMRRLDALRQA